MAEVEASLMGGEHRPSSTRYSRHNSTASHHQEPPDDYEQTAPLFSTSSRPSFSPDTKHTHTNGMNATGSGIDVAYHAYSDDSDAEAAAGLAAMQMAEDQEAAYLARGVRPSGTFHSRDTSQQSNPPPLREGGSSSESDVPVDMDTYGGLPNSYSFRYGNQLSPSRLTPRDEDPHRHTPSGVSLQRSEASSEILSMPPGDYAMGDDAIHPFPAFGARTDTGGTGGLAEPSLQSRRMSFEDGDELTLVDSETGDPTQGTPMGSARSSTTMPMRTGSRPLPPTPGGSERMLARHQKRDEFGRPIYPQAPDEYEQTFSPGGTVIHKANSIGSYSNTPYVVPPGRSITDAEQRRPAGLNTLRTSVVYENGLTPESAALASGKGVGSIDLPAIPAGKRRKFVPSKLSTHEFKRCAEPWAHSSILAWIVEMTEGESDLKISAIVEAVVALFTHKVPTMNTADAEVLSAKLVDQMVAVGALVKDEEWVKIGRVPHDRRHLPADGHRLLRVAAARARDAGPLLLAPLHAHAQEDQPADARARARAQDRGLGHVLQAEEGGPRQRAAQGRRAAEQPARESSRPRTRTWTSSTCCACCTTTA